MSLKTSPKPKAILQDNFKRPYVNEEDDDYVQEMSKFTDGKVYSEFLEKHSEFKKPYYFDDYPEMEYFYSPIFIPPWSPGDPWYPGTSFGPLSPLILHPGGPTEQEVYTVCPGGVYCGANPQTIEPGSKEIINVNGCPWPSMTLELAGTSEANGFSIVHQPIHVGGSSWAATIEASASACGACIMLFKQQDQDSEKTYSAVCYIRCTNGVWVEKSSGICEMSGHGTYAGESGSSVFYELIHNFKKQTATSIQLASGSLECPAVCTATGGCNDLCGDTAHGRSCTNCIDPCNYTSTRCSDGFPCDCVSAVQYRCWANLFTSMRYYEWECP